MNFRLPASFHREPAASALDYEIAQEQAAALAALSEHDRADLESAPATGARGRLVEEAGYALWCFIVQREACGLRDQRLIFRDYRVPREVQNRMGVSRGGSPRRI